MEYFLKEYFESFFFLLHGFLTIQKTGKKENDYNLTKCILKKTDTTKC